jgi:putative holliday junction resolvase
MGRVLALDYGTKRVGVAVTDELQIIASPLDTIHSKDLVSFLVKYVVDNEVDTIVVGEPKTLLNEPTDSTKVIDEFTVHLKRKIPSINVVRVDERFTSVLAKQTILLSGASKKKRQDKGLVDAVSAAIILQSYLEQKK